MGQREVGSLFFQVVKVMVVSGCLLGMVTGCGSRMRTTIVSGSETPKVQVTQLEPETVVVEEVVAPPVQKEKRLDIPVEEPARPAPRKELPAEIFATPKTPDVPSEMAVRTEVEPFLLSPEEPVVGIPPIAFEPEMPALPRIRQDDGPSTSQEAPITVVSPPEVVALVPEPEEPAQADIPSVPEPPAVQEPIQVAKVMPQEPEQSEIITETLEAALSDVYFDYDRFSIRDDAMEVLKTNAQLLSAQLAEKKIVIEGHCDERGTQSYNMVLGEARANAAKTFLEDLGISGDKIEVVSYGKDKPFCQDSTEECWQENRRGHFVLK